MNNEDNSISWGELAELTHATQVERFNFCTCEEQEQFPYDDCPRDESKEWEIRVTLTHEEQRQRFGWCVCEGTEGEGHMAEDCPKS